MAASSTLIGDGTEDRDWVRGPAQAPAAAPMPVDEIDAQIPMRDGIRLAVVQMVPRAEGPFPTVVVTNGYSGLDEPLFPPFRALAAQGYAVVVARLRGVAPSEGKAGLYENYGPDGYDVVEWAASQPFSNGRVGMAGASLLGISQWFAARERPPHLVALIPDDAPNDTYHYLWYAGGMPPGPGRQSRNSIPGVESEYDLALAHPTFDEFWKQRAITREDIQDIGRRGLPALLTSGWDSYLLDSASRAYGWLREAGVTDRVRLVIGPWGHASLLSDTAITGGVGPGESIAPYRGGELQRLWLDRWLRDVPTPLDDLPRVQIYVQGPDRWRFEQDWPLPDEHRESLYLCGATGEPGGLDVAPAASDVTATDVYDPATAANPVAVSVPMMAMSNDGPPQPAVETLPDGASRPYGRLIMDKSSYEARALTWTSAPLSGHTEVTGYPVLHLWASASRPDAALVVELTDVAPDGEGGASLPVTRGYRQAVPTDRLVVDAAADATDVAEYRIELSPTSYVFPTGHRVRISLQGTAIDPALTLGWQGPPPPKQDYTVTVHSGPEHPSRPTLPVIGDPPRWNQG